MVKSEFVLGAEAQKLLTMITEYVEVAIVATLTGRRMMTSYLKGGLDDSEVRIAGMAAAAIHTVEGMGAEFFGGVSYDTDTIIQVTKDGIGRIILATLSESAVLILASRRRDLDKDRIIEIIEELKALVPQIW
ncbi:MAG: hypothetical protein ACFFC7_22460 [Candidatus Hermodarchaeota archaeon]